MNCGKITKNESPLCDTPLQGGSEDKIVLFNWDEWKEFTISRNVDNPQVIEDIVMGSGVTGYLMEGKNNSVLPKTTYIKQRFSEVFDHELNYKIFTIDGETKSELEKKVKGRFVAVVENKFKGTDGDSAFEIYGADAGLVVTALTRDPNSSDTQGAFDIILKTDEFSKEPHLPSSLFDTDYNTSKAVFDSLYSA